MADPLASLPDAADAESLVGERARPRASAADSAQAFLNSSSSESKKHHLHQAANFAQLTFTQVQLLTVGSSPNAGRQPNNHHASKFRQHEVNRAHRRAKNAIKQSPGSSSRWRCAYSPASSPSIWVSSVSGTTIGSLGEALPIASTRSIKSRRKSARPQAENAEFTSTTLNNFLNFMLPERCPES